MLSFNHGLLLKSTKEPGEDMEKRTATPLLVLVSIHQSATFGGIPSYGEIAGDPLVLGCSNARRVGAGGISLVTDAPD
jgi:hypothetical protein